MINKKQMRILFVLYLLILMKVIVFKYPIWRLQEIVGSWRRDVLWEGLSGANFELFRTIKMYIRHWDNRGINSFGNLIGNVVAFIPLGYMLPRIFKSCEHLLICAFWVVLFVVGIELFQLFSAFGIFDVDDIFLNCLGALIGFLFFKVVRFSGKKNNLKE